MKSTARQPKVQTIDRLQAEKARIEALIEKAQALEYRRLISAAQAAGVNLSEIAEDALVAALRGLKSPFRSATAISAGDANSEPQASAAKPRKAG